MEAAIFDLDGTLIDSKGSILRCLNATFSEFGVEGFTDAELRANIGTALRDILAMRTDRVEEAAKRYVKLQSETFRKDISPYPGAIDLLEGLASSGKKVGVATMRKGAVARMILDDIGLMQNISAVVGWDEAPEHKPSGKHVLKTCEEMGANPGRTVFIGDSEFDIMTGKDAGVFTIGVKWGYGDHEHMLKEGADIMVSTFDDLVSELKKL